MELLDNCSSYLSECFSDAMVFQETNVKSILPFYLASRYSFYKATMLGNELLLVIGTGFGPKLTSAKVISDNKILMKLLGASHLLFVFASCDNYIRMNLVKEGISFVIPGKQIFAPSLGMIYHQKQLSKYKSSRYEAISNVVFSPSVQTILLLMLVNEASGAGYSVSSAIELTRKALCEKTGYTQMTIGRALKEIQNHIDQKIKTPLHKEHLDSFCKKAFALEEPNITSVGKRFWTLAERGVFNKIIESRIYVEKDSIPKEYESKLLLSGESALSVKSNLLSPSIKTFAINKNDWKAIKNKVHRVLPGESGSVQLEIWHTKVPLDGNQIHPFALALSVIGINDERVDSAIRQVLWG